MENITRSRGEQFIFDICQENPKSDNFTVTIQWMVNFAYILDKIETYSHNYIYTCVNIIEGLKITRIKKGYLSNNDIAILACSIYSFVKEEGLISDFEEQFSKVLDKVLDKKKNEEYKYMNDYLKDEYIENLEIILMSDD